MGTEAYQMREYIQLLGGSVEVQSSPGSGARFMVKLPLARAAAHPEPARSRDGGPTQAAHQISKGEAS